MVDGGFYIASPMTAQRYCVHVGIQEWTLVDLGPGWRCDDFRGQTGIGLWVLTKIDEHAAQSRRGRASVCVGNTQWGERIIRRFRGVEQITKHVGLVTT